MQKIVGSPSQAQLLIKQGSQATLATSVNFHSRTSRNQCSQSQLFPSMSRQKLREERMDQITQDNIAMLKRLQQAKSNYNFQQYDIERKQTEKRLNQLAYHKSSSPSPIKAEALSKFHRINGAGLGANGEKMTNRELYEIYQNSQCKQSLNDETTYNLGPGQDEQTYPDILSEKKIFSAYEPTRDEKQSSMFPDIRKSQQNFGNITQDAFFQKN